MINLSLLDEHILGYHSPDPLAYAFTGKRQAHVGASGRPLSIEATKTQFTQLLTGNEKVSRDRCLYLHIPFCRVRCTFCSFFQYAASATLVAEYFVALSEELKRKAAMPWTQAHPFAAVYIGGGTPTDLTAEQIFQLGKLIHAHFPLTEDCEITLEGRLNRFSDEKYVAAVEGGVNRFSFGVQSFDTAVRKQAKRLDNRETLLNTLNHLVAFDRAPVIVDLMFGLPGQDSECWQRDLTDFLASGAHGVDLYQLIEMENTPMARLVSEKRLPPPANTPEKSRMYANGVAFMQQQQIKQLSVNHWARDSRERSRYNHLAKTHADVLPVGAGAGGSINGYALMQTRDLEAYHTAIAENQFPLAMMMAPNPLHRLHSAIKAGFDRGMLSAHALNQASETQLFEHIQPLLAAWQDRGLLTLDTSTAQLTTAGSFWSINMAQGVIEALQGQPSAAQAA
ncbi:MAG: heme anaerobic degradation radical SAM methyltransferase ChuW/HutW [Plesiomonas sp.]|uniref:heme anaerobic degradation radical SAM methyltransferase ChuW/HutW n=1 Tax=Plesiomonas sp. TaxID=2486279 RepID=UPI003F34A3A8